MVRPTDFSDSVKKIAKKIYNVFGIFFVYLDYMYPKDDRLVIFGSLSGEYEAGSPKEIYEYFDQNVDEYQIKYYSPFLENQTLAGAIIESVKFLPYFLKAKTLISSHPRYDFFPYDWSRKKLFINTWHGFPFKTDFYTQPNPDEKKIEQISKINQKIDILLSSSKFESRILSSHFHLDSRKIQCTGHPRNDQLKGNDDRGDFDSKEVREEFDRFTNVILYAPTYRSYSSQNFPPYFNSSLRELQQMLSENDCLLVLRPHPNSKENVREYTGKNISVLSFDDQKYINDIFDSFDAIITDYSSIYCDYLYLDKPVLFTPHDREKYEKKRGLTLNNYEFWTPGPKIKTKSQLIEEIDKAVNFPDRYSEERTTIHHLLHDTTARRNSAASQVHQLITKQLE